MPAEMGSETVVLGDKDVYLNISISGSSFEIELFDALNEILQVQRKFGGYGMECGNCDHRWLYDSADISDKCPSCDSEAIRTDSRLLDAVVAMLRERHGVQRCSRRAALGYWNHVVQSADAVKKKNETPPASDSSTGSTPPTGA